LEGYDIVQKIEDVAKGAGDKPKETVKIAKSGELPMPEEDIFGTAGFQDGQGEFDGSIQDAATSPTGAATTAISTPTSEGMSILQKFLFLFLAVMITGCVVVYLRMRRVRDVDSQMVEKSLA